MVETAKANGLEPYFVNKAEQMSIKWGTDSNVQYIDPQYGFPLSIGVSGEMSLRAEDSRKLLLKLVGTESYLGQQKLPWLNGYTAIGDVKKSRA